MSIWDDPKFRKPSNAVGDWHVTRSALFTRTDDPLRTRFAVEKICGQLLKRVPAGQDDRGPVLRYAGTSQPSGQPCTVTLELKAVIGERRLYGLTVERSAPKRWDDEAPFTAECNRIFSFWCSKLQIVESAADWKDASGAALVDEITKSIAAEEAAAKVVEDPAPIAAVQKEVLDGLRAGMGFFTASKEGGSHFLFDGKVFRRSDYGEEPNVNEEYSDDAAMLAALRRFYDWDSRRDNYPHPVPELRAWGYIRGQLRKRN